MWLQIFLDKIGFRDVKSVHNFFSKLLEKMRIIDLERTTSIGAI